MQQPPVSSTSADQVLASMTIPPRPALLLALQREMRKEEPDFGKIGQLLRRDPGMAGSVLKSANSAYYGIQRTVDTVEDAILLVGLNQFGALMTGLITRRALASGVMMMARFWDVSEKRSAGMGHVAKQTRTIVPELAYSFGLFCDIGIPLLKAHFPSYLQTLEVANQGTARFTRVEDERHGINHTQAGAKLAETWGIADEVVQAIRLHHTIEAMYDTALPLAIRRLIAANLLVERAIQEHRKDNGYSEWEEGCAPAIVTLGITPGDAERLCEELKALF